eukprot:268122_1
MNKKNRQHNQKDLNQWLFGVTHSIFCAFTQQECDIQQDCRSEIFMSSMVDLNVEQLTRNAFQSYPNNPPHVLSMQWLLTLTLEHIVNLLAICVHNLCTDIIVYSLPFVWWFDHNIIGTDCRLFGVIYIVKTCGLLGGSLATESLLIVSSISPSSVDPLYSIR